MNNRLSGLALAGLFLAVGLSTAGCVSTALQLSADHPARVSAPSSLDGIEPAAILRPGAPLYRPERLALPAEMENHELQQAADSDTIDIVPEPDGTREAPFVGQGVIQKVGEGQLEIRHGTIPGFMPAMTIAYPMAEEPMSDSLEVGDEIIFNIELLPEQRYQVFSVAVVAESDEAPASETGRENDAPGSSGSSTAPTPQLQG